MSIQSNIQKINKELPLTTKLVAVSKFKPVEDILQAYEVGQRAFGESRPQELKEKVAALPSDVEWHFIGHLQTNKIKMVVPYATLIHSVDSVRLFEEIEKYCYRNNMTAEVLLELHIAQEESKHGFSEQELFSFLKELSLKESQNVVKIRGLMSMASFVDDQDIIRKEFTYLKSVFDRVGQEFSFLEDFNQLSMGMSNDYRIAIECGSTLVRIGTTIFSSRG